MCCNRVRDVLQQSSWCVATEFVMCCNRVRDVLQQSSWCVATELVMCCNRVGDVLQQSWWCVATELVMCCNRVGDVLQQSSWCVATISINLESVKESTRNILLRKWHTKEHQNVFTALHDQHWSIHFPSGSRRGRLLLCTIKLLNYTEIRKWFYSTE